MQTTESPSGSVATADFIEQVLDFKRDFCAENVIDLTSRRFGAAFGASR
jgi:hypothetical protein